MSELYAIRPVGDTSLQHYGVLGMRWGVRRNPSAAYSKATKKLTRLNNKTNSEYTKLQKRKVKTEGTGSARYRKLRQKQSKYQLKADRNKYGWFGSSSKAQKYQLKADRLGYKADKVLQKEKKTDYKYNRAKIKADRWQKSMDKAFANVNVKSLSSNQSTAAGKEFIKKVA